MPYPKKNLNANETVALDMHPHWWFFAEAGFATIVSIVFGIVVAVKSDNSFLHWLAIVLVVLSIGWLALRYLKWRTTNFVITSHRLIFREGVIAKRGIEIPLDRVNNVNFGQSILERLLGAGNLLIESGGEDGQQQFSDIRHPDRVQNLIHAQVESIRSAVGNPSGVTGQGTVNDVAGQLERLEGMLQRGTLTQDEFDAQKRKLLEH